MILLFNGVVFSVGSNSDIRLKVWYEHTRDGNKMRYRFKWRMYLAFKNSEANNPYAYYQNNRKFQLNLNGSNVYTNNAQSGASGWDTGEVVTAWYDVANKTSGTTPFSFYALDTSNTSWMNYTSPTYQLAVDPAGSSISEISNFNIGEDITVSTKIYNTDYINTLTIKLGEDIIGTRQVIEETTTVTFTEDELNNIYELTKDKTSPYEFKFELVTMDGETQIGSISELTAQGTLLNADPIIESIAISINSPVNSLDNIIKGVSNVAITVIATPQKNSTIKSVRVNGQEATLMGDVANISFLKTTTGNYDVIVEDSRGNKSTGTETRNVIDYVTLTGASSLARTSQTSGEILLTFSGNYWSGDFGGEQNTLSCVWKYREKGTENWIDGTPLTPIIDVINSKYELSNQSLNDLLEVDDKFFDYGKTYEFLVIVEDKIMRAQSPYTVSQGIPLAAWYEDNTYVVNGDIDIDGKIYQNGKEFKGGGDSLPIGTMLPIGTTNTDHIPANWLVCDGREVSRTAYEKLFNVIGTNYGAGDGNTTFNLPDKRGRVSVGLDEAQNEFNAIGKKGGSKYLQAHKHNVLDGSYSNPTNVFGYNDGSGYNVPSIKGVHSAGTGGKLITDTVGEGDSGNLQPYEIDNWIIKALSGETEIPEETMATVTNEYSESVDKLYSCDFINSGLSNKEDKQLVVDYEGTPKASSFVIDGLHLDTNDVYEYVVVVTAAASTGFTLFYNGDQSTSYYYNVNLNGTSGSVSNSAYDRTIDAPRIGVTGIKPSLINGVIRRDSTRILNNFTSCNLDPSWARISLGLQAYSNAPDVLTSLTFSTTASTISYLSVKIYRRGN